MKYNISIFNLEVVGCHAHIVKRKFNFIQIVSSDCSRYSLLTVDVVQLILKKYTLVTREIKHQINK